MLRKFWNVWSEINKSCLIDWFPFQIVIHNLQPENFLLLDFLHTKTGSVSWAFKSASLIHFPLRLELRFDLIFSLVCSHFHFVWFHFRLFPYRDGKSEWIFMRLYSDFFLLLIKSFYLRNTWFPRKLIWFKASNMLNQTSCFHEKRLSNFLRDVNI